MNRKMWATILMVSVIGHASLLYGQDSAFTYQGQLKDAGAPANGAYDLTFRLFDDELGGNQVGADLAEAGAIVNDGLFTVSLDFGPDIYTSIPLWLEIEVNAVVLTPRQAITGAPLAINTRGISVDATGQMGIGVTPTARLELGGTPGVDGIKFPDGTLQTSASGPGGGPWQTNGSDVWYGGGGVGVIGGSSPFPFGKGVFIEGGSATSAQIFAFNYDAFAPLSLILNAPGGNVGIGISVPASKLTVVSTTTPYTIHGTAGANSIGVVGTATGAGARGIHGSVSGTSFCGASGDHQASQNYGLLGTLNEGIYARGAGTSRAINAVSDTGTAVHAESNGNFAAGVTGVSYHAAGFGGYFQNNAGGLALRCNGRASVAILEITGADLAEKFPTSDGKVEPGMVMEIDPENAGLLRMSHGAYNQRVAGVISGANDFPSGAILGHLPGMEDAPPIALSGRVWTWCDASEAAIVPGDLLTTSATPGHAMKSVDRDRSHGAVIGKAMTPLSKGERGLVLVLVNLQ